MMKVSVLWKYGKVVLKVLVSLLLLWWVLRQIQDESIWRAIGAAKLEWVLVATLFYIVSKWFSAIRLLELFKACNIPLNKGFNLRMYLLSMFYNLFLPGGVGGDAYKAYYINRQTGKPLGMMLKVILVDRLSGMFILLVLCLLFLFGIPLPYAGLYYAIVPAILMGGLCYYFVVRWFQKELLSVFHLSNFWSMGVQLTQLAGAWALMMAVDLHEHYWLYMEVFLISSVVSVLPLTIGGLGAREMVFLYASKWFLLQEAPSVAISMLFYILTSVVALAGAYYALFPGKLGKVSDE